MLKILELKLLNHPVIGDLDLNFIEDNEKSFLSYYTVLIGPNGTGKSFILQALINIFREAGYFLNKDKYKRSGAMSGSFYLKYIINDDVIEIGNISYFKDTIRLIRSITQDENRTSLLFRVNGKSQTEGDFLPKAILASTMIFTDKFPAVIDSSLPQYHYFGIRNIKSPSTAGTKALNTTLTNSLISSINKPGVIKSLNKILSNLKYIPSIRISYTPKYANIFYNKNLNPTDLRSLFSNWQSVFKNRKTEPWGKKYFDSIEGDYDLIEKIVLFLNSKELRPYGQGGKFFEYDLLDGQINNADFKILNHLHKLDLISFPTIQLHKQGGAFELTSSSSGEQNIVFSLLTLLGKIEENSLVLIDEPELSLHPNWQMQYFEILNEIFKEYEGIHFIIATHSHFLISDLKGDNSKIIGLRRDEKIEVVDLPKNLDTYGWSAEDVLYNVFQVTTSRNYFVALEIGEILKIVAKKDIDFATLNSKKGELQKIKSTLKTTDPLRSLIDKVQKEFFNV